jgi:hypothetical protein
MTLRPEPIGFTCRGTLTGFPMRRMACLRRGVARAGGPGKAAQAIGGAPHTMPPAIRKTAVLTKRPGVIEVYPRSPGAPMPLPHHAKPGDHHGR